VEREALPTCRDECPRDTRSEVRNLWKEAETKQSPEGTRDPRGVRVRRQAQAPLEQGLAPPLAPAAAPQSRRPHAHGAHGSVWGPRALSNLSSSQAPGSDSCRSHRKGRLAACTATPGVSTLDVFQQAASQPVMSGNKRGELHVSHVTQWQSHHRDTEGYGVTCQAG
jgi:hypothetical protein